MRQKKRRTPKQLYEEAFKNAIWYSPHDKKWKKGGINMPAVSLCIIKDWSRNHISQTRPYVLEWGGRFVGRLKKIESANISPFNM